MWHDVDGARNRSSLWAARCAESRAFTNAPKACCARDQDEEQAIRTKEREKRAESRETRDMQNKREEMEKQNSIAVHTYA